MDRSPSLHLVLETAWRLFLDRGWMIFAVMLITSLPLRAHAVLVHLDLVPNLFSMTSALAGERPTLSSSGLLSFLWYSQKVLVINGIASIFLFGWLQAIAIIACCTAAVRWQSGDRTTVAQIVSQLPIAILPVWIVLVIKLIGTMIASTAFVLPGMALNALWYVAGFVAASERLGPIQSLKRSASLTLQYWWGVFAIICAFALVSFGFGFFQSTVLLPIFVSSELEVEQWSLIHILIRNGFNFASDLLNIIIVASLFLVLKRAKNGPGHHELDQAFA